MARNAFDERVLAHESKSRRPVIEPEGIRHHLPGRRRVAFPAIDRELAVRRGLSEGRRRHQEHDRQDGRRPEQYHHSILQPSGI